MMTEYIEREAVKEAIGFIRLHHIEYAENKSLLDAINEIPAADVALVKHGRWNDGDPYCPVCGKDKFGGLDADVWADWKPNFCPNCGAMMDGD